jgi:hypothetical protein
MSEEPEPTVVQDGGFVVSTCCHALVSVTRVVHDVVEYLPTSLEAAEGDWPATLHVKFDGRVDSLDSDGYTARCESCLRELDVESIEED